MTITRTAIRKMGKPELVEFANAHCLFEHLDPAEVETMTKKALVDEIFGAFLRIEVAQEFAAAATDTVAKSLDEVLGFVPADVLVSDEPAKVEAFTAAVLDVIAGADPIATADALVASTGKGVLEHDAKTGGTVLTIVPNALTPEQQAAKSAPSGTLAPRTRRQRNETAKKAAPAKKRDTSIKTWTLAGIEVRAAVAEIRVRENLPKGGKFEIGTRAVPVYATTKTEALVTPEGDDLVEFYSVEKGTNLPEVRGHGYVAHLYVTAGGELRSVWTVWLSPDGPVLLTQSGKRVKA